MIGPPKPTGGSHHTLGSFFIRCPKDISFSFSSFKTWFSLKLPGTWGKNDDDNHLEPQTTIYKWLFQLDDSQSLYRKWLFHQTSILNWLFGVPGTFCLRLNISSPKLMYCSPWGHESLEDFSTMASGRCWISFRAELLTLEYLSMVSTTFGELSCAQSLTTRSKRFETDVWPHVRAQDTLSNMKCEGSANETDSTN